MKTKKLLLPLALMPIMAMIPIVALSCSKTETTTDTNNKSASGSTTTEGSTNTEGSTTQEGSTNTEGTTNTEVTPTQGTPTQGKSTTTEGSTTDNKPKTKTIKEQADELKTALTEENKKITDTVLPIVKTIQPSQTAGQKGLNRLMKVYSGIEKHQKENEKLIKRLEESLTEDDFTKVKYSLAEMSKTIAKQFQDLLSLYKEGIIEKTPDFEFQKNELFKEAEKYIANKPAMDATKETSMMKEKSMNNNTSMMKKTSMEATKETPMMKETSMNNNASMKEKTPMEAPKETSMEQR